MTDSPSLTSVDQNATKSNSHGKTAIFRFLLSKIPSVFPFPTEGKQRKCLLQKGHLCGSSLQLTLYASILTLYLVSINTKKVDKMQLTKIGKCEYEKSHSTAM